MLFSDRTHVITDKLHNFIFDEIVQEGNTVNFNPIVLTDLVETLNVHLCRNEFWDSVYIHEESAVVPQS